MSVVERVATTALIGRFSRARRARADRRWEHSSGCATSDAVNRSRSTWPLRTSAFWRRRSAQDAPPPSRGTRVRRSRRSAIAPRQPPAQVASSEERGRRGDRISTCSSSGGRPRRHTRSRANVSSGDSARASTRSHHPRTASAPRRPADAGALAPAPIGASAPRCSTSSRTATPCRAGGSGNAWTSAGSSATIAAIRTAGSRIAGEVSDSDSVAGPSARPPRAARPPARCPRGVPPPRAAPARMRRPRWLRLRRRAARSKPLVGADGRRRAVGRDGVRCRRHRGSPAATCPETSAGHAARLGAGRVALVSRHQVLLAERERQQRSRYRSHRAHNDTSTAGGVA